jgi:hypothetical protein
VGVLALDVRPVIQEKADDGQVPGAGSGSKRPDVQIKVPRSFEEPGSSWRRAWTAARSPLLISEWKDSTESIPLEREERDARQQQQARVHTDVGGVHTTSSPTRYRAMEYRHEPDGKLESAQHSSWQVLHASRSRLGGWRSSPRSLRGMAVHLRGPATPRLDMRLTSEILGSVSQGAQVVMVLGER